MKIFYVQNIYHLIQSPVFIIFCAHFYFRKAY